MRGRKYKLIFMVAVLLTISIASLSLNKMIVNASSNKPGTMKVKVLSKSDRTAECVKINSDQDVIKLPNLVSINGSVYKISKIGKKALANNKTVTKVMGGRYITTIGDEAFKNCKNLRNA